MRITFNSQIVLVCYKVIVIMLLLEYCIRKHMLKLHSLSCELMKDLKSGHRTENNFQENWKQRFYKHCNFLKVNIGTVNQMGRLTSLAMLDSANDLKY